MSRKISLWVLFLSFFSCSTDFELEAPYQDIPIVYGFLSLQDTAHYIRIEKAFLEPGGDANAIAQIPDSIYYGESLIVELERVNTGQRYTLNRVDGNLDGYPRAAGPFVQSPNYLYKILADDINLRGGEPIRLIINRGEALPLVTAQTIVLDEIFIRESNPVSPVNLDYDRRVSFVFNVGESAQLFDVRLLMKIREEINGNVENRTIEWVLRDDLRRASDEGRVAVEIMGEDFYRFLGSALSTENGIRRSFLGFDVLVTAGGQEFVDLLTVTEANLGITSAQLVPTFTNLSEGRGIFSSRATALRPDVILNTLSVDSLRNGIYTRDLGF